MDIPYVPYGSKIDAYCFTFVGVPSFSLLPNKKLVTICSVCLADVRRRGSTASVMPDSSPAHATAAELWGKNVARAPEIGVKICMSMGQN